MDEPKPDPKPEKPSHEETLTVLQDVVNVLGADGKRDHPSVAYAQEHLNKFKP